MKMVQSKQAPVPPAAYTNFLRIAQQGSEFFLAFGQLTLGEIAVPEPGAGKAAASDGAAAEAGKHTSARQRVAPESSPKRARRG